MEQKVIQILVLTVCYACFAMGDIVVSTPYIRAQMGHRVTLPCKFTATSDDWMFLRWTKTANDSTVNIATMQNHILNADWASTAPEELRDHSELQKRVEGNDFSVDIVIDDFRCYDVGVYKCEVFTMSATSSLWSNTTLEIEAPPGVPSINANSIEVKENTTFRIECNANVGVPAHTISWMYTLEDAPHIYQKVESGYEQENSLGDDCTFNARSTLNLEMTSELNGATFICTTTNEIGDDGKPAKNDEVLINLYGIPTTTITTTAAATSQKLPAAASDINAAPSVPASISAIFVCFLVTIFNLFRSRT